MDGKKYRLIEEDDTGTAQIEIVSSINDQQASKLAKYLTETVPDIYLILQNIDNVSEEWEFIFGDFWQRR
jgi:hypothetical protein